MNDLVLHIARDSVFIHAFPQLHLDFFHAPFGPLESERPAQFLGLTAAEARRDHGHSQQLFLK